ncbi:MAG: radical SAM protein [Nitrospirae bacterium]|nr:radical SAM protein [Nitrospirota bacterium]
MKINEIFKSIQGESTYAGLPCIFVRLTGCNLRCSYCDTTYAYEEGKDLNLAEVLKRVRAFSCSLVEVTGGEPLLQEEAYSLMEKLLENGYQVLLETNGSQDISRVDPRVIRIIDIKCPDSGMSEKMDWENMKRLKKNDEVKFVLSSRTDYQWAKAIISRYDLGRKVRVLVSPAMGRLQAETLAEWILRDALPVRLQLQMQKYIWPQHLRKV